MSHEITFTNGKAEMAYAGYTPWHGLGQKLEAKASLETWRKAAGMDWKVERAGVNYQFGGKQHTFASQQVILRSDTHTPLAVVGSDYNVVQPAEVMEFFADLCKDNGYQMETAGTLFGGRRYWALAKTGQTVSLPGKDVIGGFLLLATSCDGSMSTTAKFTTVRVVCNNTLQMSMHNSEPAVKVRHNTTFNQTLVKIDMGLAEKTWTEFSETAKALADKKVTEVQVGRALASAFGDVEKFDLVYGLEKDLAPTLKQQPNGRGMQRILALFNGEGKGADLKSAKGTAWGALNATTQYLDYEGGREDSNRLYHTWFGTNMRRKQAVAAELLAV